MTATAKGVAPLGPATSFVISFVLALNKVNVVAGRELSPSGVCVCTELSCAWAQVYILRALSSVSVSNSQNLCYLTVYCVYCQYSIYVNSDLRVAADCEVLTVVFE